MKRAGLFLLVSLFAACSAAPTSPSATATSEVLSGTSQDAKPDHTSGTVKVTIYFYSDDIGYGGNVHVVNMPVALASVPAAVTATTTTNRQASVSIDVPKATTGVTWTVLPNRLGYCIESGTLNVPYGTRDNWFVVHRACGQ